MMDGVLMPLIDEGVLTRPTSLAIEKKALDSLLWQVASMVSRPMYLLGLRFHVRYLTIMSGPRE